MPTTRTIPIANSGNQGGIQMWPSEELASRLYNLANVGLIVGLVLGVASTVLLVWMGNVKESYLRKSLVKIESANLHLKAELEHAIAESRSRQTELEIEQRKTAEAQQAAAEAQLKLRQAIEMVSTPRRIFLARLGRDEAAWAANLKEVQIYAGTPAVITSVPDVEAQGLASDIRTVLAVAGWNATIADATESNKIPLNVFREGVQVRTVEKIVPNSGPIPESQYSAASRAARALVGLLNVELGRPYGAPLSGVSWVPEFVIKEESGDFKMGALVATGFSFPDGGVVITVGMPTHDFLLFHDAAQPTKPK
jgi:hypothetical protein